MQVHSGTGRRVQCRDIYPRRSTPRNVTVFKSIRRSAQAAPSSPARPAADTWLALLLILLAAPAMLIIAATLMLESGEPLLTRRPSRGTRGAFSLLAFRTSPRSRLGQFLRRRRLENLPRLFNVIGGSLPLRARRHGSQIRRDLPLRPMAALSGR